MHHWWDPNVFAAFCACADPAEGAAGHPLGNGFRRFDMEPPREERCNLVWLQDYCKHPDTPVEYAALAVMLWAGMRSIDQPRFWNSRAGWVPLLCKLRQENRLSRKAAYASFQEAALTRRLQGVGPANISRLIVFLLPQAGGHIMDQRMAQALETLAPGRRVIRWAVERGVRAKYAVRADTSSAEYEAFCRMIDDLAAYLRRSPSSLALSLSGGDDETQKDSRSWRRYVAEHWIPPGRPWCRGE